MEQKSRVGGARPGAGRPPNPKGRGFSCHLYLRGDHIQWLEAEVARTGARNMSHVIGEWIDRTIARRARTAIDR